jgi:multifunctional methyltransferase subunit TRM112
MKKEDGIPETREGLNEDDEEQMKKVHHALLEVHIITGYLVCTETGRKFPIHAGIPNMLLNQDEL